jgi:hypothetical protein
MHRLIHRQWAVRTIPHELEPIWPGRRPTGMKILALCTALLLTAAACGSDDPASSGSDGSTSTVQLPSTEETSPPIPDPVDTGATTPPPSTDPPDSVEPTSPPADVTWTDVDAYPSGFGPGCCGSNSTGPTSPPLADDPAPLADGVYSFDVVEWSADDPTALRVSVRAFVPCADGVQECSPSETGTYGPGEIGLSDTSRQIDIVLDGSVVAYVAGDDTSGSFEEDLRSILRSTDGNGLAALMTAMADAYDTAIATPLRAGTPIDDIVADLQANPAHGFTSATDLMTGQLYFTTGDAPPVLFQAVADQGAPLERSGTSALIPRTLTVDAGTISLELYAGFRS